MAGGRRPFSWRDRYPEQVTCVRCLQVKDTVEVDRLLWCDDCQSAAKSRAAFWGWLGGFVIAAALAAYIWVAIQPSDLILKLWAVIPIAALWLGGRIVREVVYGVERYRNRRAVDAFPPSRDPGPRANGGPRFPDQDGEGQDGPADDDPTD